MDNTKMSRVEKIIWTTVTTVIGAGALFLQSKETLEIFNIPAYVYAYVAAGVDILTIIGRNVYLKVYKKNLEI